MPNTPDYLYGIKHNEDLLAVGTDPEQLGKEVLNNILPEQYPYLTMWRYFNNRTSAGLGTLVAMPDIVTAQILCARGACREPGAYCIHTTDGRRYCHSCAIQLNEHGSSKHFPLVVIPPHYAIQRLQVVVPPTPTCNLVEVDYQSYELKPGEIEQSQKLNSGDTNLGH